ncbi:MAG: hypothetical protein MZW92_76320 [Comamonadaceae bacterium]|nr:hypothetical protein [Comamonadaceae bacterium]
MPSRSGRAARRPAAVQCGQVQDRRAQPARPVERLRLGRHECPRPAQVHARNQADHPVARSGGSDLRHPINTTVWAYGTPTQAPTYPGRTFVAFQDRAGFGAYEVTLQQQAGECRRQAAALLHAGRYSPWTGPIRVPSAD